MDLRRTFDLAEIPPTSDTDSPLMNQGLVFPNGADFWYEKPCPCGLKSNALLNEPTWCAKLALLHPWRFHSITPPAPNFPKPAQIPQISDLDTKTPASGHQQIHVVAGAQTSRAASCMSPVCSANQLEPYSGASGKFSCTARAI